MALAPDLLEMLACPHCLAPVREAEGRLHCTRDACGLRYAIEEGIPNMLLDDADKACPKCAKPRAYDGRVLACAPCKLSVADPREAGGARP